MAEIPDSVIKKIELFLAELKNNHFKIEKAVLFGSYAKGVFNDWSDIDLALVSDDFSGDVFEDKCKIRKFKAASSWDISPMPFRKNDFENSIFARDEILSNGISIL